MMDLFWFVVFCFFFFYLPVRLWVIKGENEDLGKNLQDSQSIRQSTSYSNNYLQNELFDAKKKLFTLECQVAALNNAFYGIENIHERMGKICKHCKKSYPCDTMKVIKGL